MAEDRTSRDCDAVVIGGGPAGAAAAAVLAGAGRRVIVLEKADFPRYRIGESLIPHCWFPLNRIGMINKLARSDFVKKYSVQFVGLDGRTSNPFYFFKHIEHDCARTWQVVRSTFDRMLIDNAREKGAEVRIGAQVRDLIEADDGRVAGGRGRRTDDGEPFEIRAPVTIDASGRDGLAMNRFGWRVRDRKLSKIACWTYYRGARRDEGIDEGTTTVAYLPEKGWFWYIPLPEDTVSVGIVAERDYLYRGERDPDAIFNRETQIQPWIRRYLAPGTRMAPCRVTGDYSYRARHCATDGLVLVGDAFAFLDPVFSSGVFLALQSGVMAADAVHEALEAGDTRAERFGAYGERLCAEIEAMRKLVYAFYDRTFSFGDMLRKHPHLRGDLTDCLIGNLDRDFGPLFEAVGEFADVPGALPHGRPLTRADRGATGNPGAPDSRIQVSS